MQKKLQQIKGAETNLYDHLKGVLSSLLLHHPKDALGMFEQYSFNMKDQSHPEIVFKVRESFEHLKQFEQSNRVLLKKINTGTEQQPQEPASIPYVPNLMEENRLLERVGVGVGEDQAYKAYKSLAILASKKNPKYLKFWGKILGQKDYYVAEGVSEGNQAEEGLPSDAQPKGTGVNALSYWVTNSLSQQWTELPTVTPQQIRVSRKIKYIFKGQLGAKIVSNPNFPGTEAHLLKCQIVRISSSSTIIQRGVSVVNPDNDRQVIPYDVSPEEKQYVKPLDTLQLNTLSNWVHQSQSILSNGRTSHVFPEAGDGDDQQKIKADIRRRDPFESRLKPLSEDTTGRGWKIGVKQEQNIFRGLGKSGTPVNYSVIYLKNMDWPGWTTIYHLNKITSLYVGYGLKARQTFSPCSPDNILSQKQDREEASDQ